MKKSAYKRMMRRYKRDEKSLRLAGLRRVERVAYSIHGQGRMSDGKGSMTVYYDAIERLPRRGGRRPIIIDLETCDP